MSRRSRDGGCEANRPVGVAPFGKREECLLQLNRALRVIAGLGHVQHAVLIGFALGVAAVLLREQLRSQRRHHHAHFPGGGIVEGAAENDHGGHRTELHEHALGLGAGALGGVSVHDFVTQHGGQLSFRIQLRQQAAVDRDLAARQGPGIGHRIVQNAELKIQFILASGALRQAVADFLHIGRQFGVHDEVATL